MNILPASRGAKIRFGILLLALCGVVVFYRLDRLVAYYLSDKQHGDIVFQSLPRGPLVDAIEGVTESEWSHCGILLYKDDMWVVAEAIGLVRYTPLHLWILRGRKSRIVSYRLISQPNDNGAKLFADIDRLLGRPYDYRYAPEDHEIYCSELVYKVYDRSYGIKIGEWEKLESLNWQNHEAFIREMENGKLPLDRPMITPVGLTRSQLVYRVY